MIQESINIKYVGYILGKSLFGQSMAWDVFDQENLRVKILHRQNCFSTLSLRRLLRNAKI